MYGNESNKLKLTHEETKGQIKFREYLFPFDSESTYFVLFLLYKN
jgi:hypothetical protein